jgi:hypothetical protein
MNRQLRADGGIMQVAPREKFGLGSDLKKFVRKIIPNEVAEIAVKAAPFVAPFNPAVAAAMSGLGSFDKSGRIGDSLKSGALTYGLGQGARFLGGAELQGNPFQQGGAFRGGFEGFKGGFSSPLGTQSGFKLGKPTQRIDTSMPLKKPNLISEQLSEVSLSPSGTVADTVKTVTDPGSAMESIKSIVSFDTSATQKTDAALDLLKRGSKALFYDSKGRLDKNAVLGAITGVASYIEAKALADEAGVELSQKDYDDAKRDEKREEYAGYLQNFFGGKKDGGRIGFKDGPSESDIFGIGGETLMKDKGKTIKKGFKSIGDLILDDEGNMYTPLQYLRKFGEDIFFGGQKNPELPEEFYNKLSDEYVQEMKQVKERGYANGGRIGFESGANEMIKTQLLEEIIPDTSTEDFVIIMTEDGPVKVKKSELPPESMMMDTSTGFGTNITRVDRKFGSPKEGESEVGIMTIDVEAGDDEDEEDMMMAGGITFSSAEKTYLFRRLGGGSGSNKQFKNLYGVLSNPNKYPEDAAILKEIAIMGLGKGQKDGGRIGLKDGTDAIRDIDFLLEGQDEFSMQEFGKKVSELNSAERKELADKIYSYELKFKNGGRIGYKKGANRVSELLITRAGILAKDPDADVSDIDGEIFQLTGKTFRSVGGISNIPTGKMRKNNAGVVERDYRDEGGFVPVGIKERADDVPAMLSKNEFVMTADAVRGIGNGSVEEGSKKLYNTMKKAEQVGKA